jgi:putative nucleotidyltransferase with HDIG domain
MSAATWLKQGKRMHSIHRLVITRLFLAWFFLSALAGSAVFLIEIQKIDHALTNLAASELQRFAPGGLDTQGMSPDELERLQQQAHAMLKRNFLTLEAYNPQQQLILTLSNPAFAALEKELPLHAPRFPDDGGTHYQRFEISGETLLQIAFPLRGKDGQNAGYLKAVLIVNPDDLARHYDNLKRYLASVLLCVLVTTCLFYPLIISLNRKATRFAEKVIQGNLEIVTVLGAAIAERDSDTGDHNYRVTLYAIGLAEAFGVEQVDMRALILGAFLHDVGKIGIRDSILLKPAALDADELSIMRTHVQLGVSIIQTSTWLQTARDVIEFHHEWYDGSGYLKGLRAEEIPLVARIFAVADSFDALTSQRPYKDAWSCEEALAILRKDAGSHFDPALVQAFEGIADGLYRQFAQASEASLNRALRGQVRHHYAHIVSSDE